VVESFSGAFSINLQGSFKRAFGSFLKIPVPYVFALAIGLRGLQADLPQPVLTTVGYLGDGLIPVALITLGAQLAETRLRSHLAPISCAVALRLVLAPIVAAALVFCVSTTGLLPWDSLTSKVLIVNAAIPAAVNTVIVSMEFKSHPEVAAGAILYSTLLSAVTVTVVLGWIGFP
jgi:predicted permease